MDFKRIIFVITFLLSCSSSFADDYKKVMTLSAGPAWSRAGDTQTVYLTGIDFRAPTFFTFSESRYNAVKNTQTMGMAEIFLALQWPFNCFYNFNNQLGVAFGMSNEAKMQGTIDVNKVPSGSNYEYRTNHGWVSVRGKTALAPEHYYIQPYITASIGAGFNKAYGFRTFPMIDTYVSSPWYGDNTTSFAFTYSAGAGIQKNIGCWDLGFGYEFADWGKSGLGHAVTAPWRNYNRGNDGPYLTHIYAHRLLFSLSYIFC